MQMQMQNVSVYQKEKQQRIIYQCLIKFTRIYYIHIYTQTT